MGELRQRVAEHARAELDQQAGLLGERQELVRRQQPTIGVQPARQHLVADHAAGGELDDRLEVRHDLAALDAMPQLAGRAQRLHAGLVATDLERLDAVAATRLGAVHRGIGVAQQVVGRHARLRSCVE